MTAITLRTVLMLALLAALGACVSIKSPAPAVVYVPDFSVEPVAAASTVRWSLRIMTPTAGEMLDSTGIAVRPVANRLQNYKGALWAEPVPALLQSAVLRAFEDSGAIASVARAGSGVRSDYSLLLDIRHFEAIYPTPGALPVVTVEVQAKLVSADGVVIAARSFRQALETSDSAVPEVVATFAKASSTLIAELVAWTLRSGPDVPAP